MASPGLVVRVDATARMGAGHVMRCCALAHSWRDRGGSVLFVMADAAASVRARLRDEQLEVVASVGTPASQEDALATARLIGDRRASWVVLDGYHFDEAYARTLRASGAGLLLLDDNGEKSGFDVDLLLNQNVHAEPALYLSAAPSTRLLLGTRFALLRREFGQWTEWPRVTRPVARNILVTMGGGDADNVTMKVLQGLVESATKDTRVAVLVGGANPHLRDLESFAASSLLRPNLVLDARNVPELMAWADLAITGAGSTCWELAMMGLPAITIVLAENQRRIAELLHDQGVCRSLGAHAAVTSAEIAAATRALITDEASRADMSERGRRLVDGRGAARVVDAMRGFGTSAEFGVRPPAANVERASFLEVGAKRSGESPSSIETPAFPPTPIIGDPRVSAESEP